MKKWIKFLIPESVRRFIRVTRSDIGALWYRYPANKLILIGVTGTSGKSTTASMIYHILHESGYSVGLISTLGARAGQKNIDTGLHVTTPDPIALHKILGFMVKKQIKYVVIETSSHALAQGRLGRIQFDHAVYTNIKRDHLDWHGTWENYAQSKALLAKKLKENGSVFLNREDKDMYTVLFNTLGEEFAKKTLTYSFKEIVNVDETKDGINFRYNDTNFSLPIIGLYNVENALAAISVTAKIGIGLKDISKAFENFNGVEGRMQIMQKSPFMVIVDFAHNTDSLTQSLQTARKLSSSHGKTIVVFGSAGLRDVEKRYTMGEVAAQFADIVIIAAEDPRTESLYDINSQIIEGTEKSGGILINRFATHQDYQEYKIDPKEIESKSVFVFDQENIQNRFDAIDFAISIASEGDVVITEGKGHEKSLCFGTIEYPYTDQEAVKKSLEEQLNNND
jgi:UDP-N-acetylmuramoyl-L-alanyl-D-glutamate--2,6-diaminopimelate ligase